MLPFSALEICKCLMDVCRILWWSSTMIFSECYEVRACSRTSASWSLVSTVGCPPCAGHTQSPPGSRSSAGCGSFRRGATVHRFAAPIGCPECLVHSSTGTDGDVQFMFSLSNSEENHNVPSFKIRTLVALNLPAASLFPNFANFPNSYDIES